MVNWCDHKLRRQALDQLAYEDLEAHDMMACAYPDHPHPAYRSCIQHLGNGGEYHVPRTPFTVDGFHPETNTVYEFHGCFWHGCPKCYPVHDENHLRLHDRTMNDVYQKSQNKMTCIRAKGSNVIKMWECKWTRLKQTRSHVQASVDSLQFVEPSTLVTPFAGDTPMPSNCIIT